MNKRNSILFIICALVVLLIAKIFFFPSRIEHRDYSVALFAPALHPSMENIMRGFKETLSKDSKKTYSFAEYNANGSSFLLRGQADDIVAVGYDLIFTIGTFCTQTVFELTRKEERTVPIVFSAVNDPIKIGVVQSIQRPNTNVTGVLSKSDYAQQVEALLEVKPDVKRVLLVYNPAGGVGFDRDKEELTALFAEKNVDLFAVEVSQSYEITQKVSAHLSEVDVVFVLTDHTVVAGIDSLITLCSRYGVTLYTSELDSGNKGAALSFGVKEYDYGMLAARLALDILEGGHNPANLPCVMITKNYLQINTKNMRQQGLQLDDDQIELVRARGGIIL